MAWLSQENRKSWWFLQQSDDIQYLLLSQSRLRGVSVDTPSSDVLEFQNLGLGVKRSEAIEYYFKSVKAVLLLQQTCLNSHKDVTREQVTPILNLWVVNSLEIQLSGNQQDCSSFSRTSFSVLTK